MSKLSLLITFVSLLFKLSLARAPGTTDRFVVWDIGQGQWVTHVMTDECVHYDIGGELGTFPRIKKSFMNSCGQKKNYVLLSHWDFDHYINLISVAQNVSNICWLQQPTVTKRNRSIEKILALKVPICTENPKIEISQWIPESGKNTNDSSIVNWDHGFLMEGDSPVKKEKVWNHQLKQIERTKVLILGHHGSRTSTSSELLQNLPHLQMAVVSARFKKYGHPHKETLARLAKNKTPVLRTEDWGSIWFN